MNMIIYEFFLFFYFIGGLSLSLLLFEIKNGLFFLFIVITNYSHDIFAYFGGKLFGKTKFFNNISPSKTLEGYISGVVFSFLIGYTISIKFNLLVLDYYKIILITLAIAFLSVFGDLFESVIKRAAQVKESGNIIPGHGGVLDRIDSLIFSIFISFFMYFIP
jgi:phosphatidate cytidylyltransferase